VCERAKRESGIVSLKKEVNMVTERVGVRRSSAPIKRYKLHTGHFFQLLAPQE